MEQNKTNSTDHQVRLYITSTDYHNEGPNRDSNLQPLDEFERKNPWAVESIMAFNFFLCPECDFQAKTPPNFENHALENHPRSKKLFDSNEIPKIKSEHDVIMEKILNEVKEEPYLFDIGLEDADDFEEYLKPDSVDSTPNVEQQQSADFIGIY